MGLFTTALSYASYGLLVYGGYYCFKAYKEYKEESDRKEK